MRYQRPYDLIASSLDSQGDRDRRMQRFVDVLWDHLSAQGVAWVGFYLDTADAADTERLVLGPRRDKPACSPIGLHGACGQTLLSKRTLIVHDVADLGEGYIACDPRDRSEIVIPLIDENENCWGVLDLDSFDVGAFDRADEAGLRLALVKAGLIPASKSEPDPPARSALAEEA